MDLISIVPSFNLYDAPWPIRTYQAPSPPAKTLFPDKQDNRVGVALESLIAIGYIISGSHVQRSILSPRVRVHSYAQVYDSILMEGGIHRGARIKRAIIDKIVVIPEGYEIGYDLEAGRNKFVITPNGVVVVSKGMVLEH